jgi:PKD repeat protein
VLFYPWLAGNGTWTQVVTEPPPGDGALVADFEYSCGNTATCTFTDRTTSTGDIAQWTWSWTFQNGTPPDSDLENPETTFVKDGNNRVTLTVTAGGVSDHHTKSIFCRSHRGSFRCG